MHLNYYKFLIDNSSIYRYVFFIMDEFKIYSHVFQKGEVVDRKLSLSFLCDCLSSYLNRTIQPEEIFKNRHGQPFLTSEKNLFFSLSHSENVIGVAISNKKLGFDMQFNKDVNLKIWQRISTEQEKKIKQNLFFDYWCIKEAALKFYGSGFKFPMNRIEVDMTTRTLSPILKDFDFSAIQDLQNDFIKYPVLKYIKIEMKISPEYNKTLSAYLVQP